MNNTNKNGTLNPIELITLKFNVDYPDGVVQRVINKFPKRWVQLEDGEYVSATSEKSKILKNIHYLLKNQKTIEIKLSDFYNQSPKSADPILIKYNNGVLGVFLEKKAVHYFE